MSNYVVTQSELDRYAEWIKADYKRGDESRQIQVTFDRGSKFIRVVTCNLGQSSSHSFIVVKDTPKWPAGTILKCASWKAPAQNFARGHLSNETYNRVTWTGAH